MKNKQSLPPMSPIERADLEHEAGRAFVSDEQAYEYLRRKTDSQLLDNMLERTK